MSRFILVLGVHTTERDAFGGVVDIDKAQEKEADTILVNAVHKALDDHAANPQHLCGTAEATGDVCDPALYISMPFEGVIENEVLLYVD